MTMFTNLACRIIVIVGTLACLALSFSGCHCKYEASQDSENEEQYPTLNRTIMDKIVGLSDQIMREHGFDLTDYRRDITEDSVTYYVKYSLFDTLMLGGGALISIAKKDLKVVAKVFEQ